MLIYLDYSAIAVAFVMFTCGLRGYTKGVLVTAAMLILWCIGAFIRLALGA